MCIVPVATSTEVRIVLVDTDITFHEFMGFNKCTFQKYKSLQLIRNIGKWCFG